MARTTRSSQVAAVPQSITNFARVSKSSSLLLSDPLKNKAAVTTTVVEIPSPATPTSRKRKTSDNREEEVQTPARTRTRTRGLTPQVLGTPTKRACRREEAPSAAAAPAKSPSTPAKGKRVAKATPSRTRSAHNPSQATILSEANRESRNVQTKIDASFQKAKVALEAKKQEKDQNDLPPHLAELVSLHKAFLKTVLLQFTHNGAHVPIDLHTLAPNIARGWGKRTVTVEDIRHCIALQGCESEQTNSPFMLSDYGRGRLCIELRPGQNEFSSVNETRLCRQFESNLRIFMSERNMDEMNDVDEISLDKLSLADLPKVEITNMSNGAAANPLLAKGQRALAELKNGIQTKQQEKEVKAAVAANGEMLNADGSKMSLLDRLRAKQLVKASGPLPPTGPELARRAALNRVADVSATVSLMSLSNPMSLPRQAFTMNVILEKLKDSLRVPVSREEGSECVRLIAREVAPEWLKVVLIGGRETVVVQRSAQPFDKVLAERVQRLTG